MKWWDMVTKIAVTALKRRRSDQIRSNRLSVKVNSIDINLEKKTKTSQKKTKEMY